ncbi:MAG: glycerol acyltransferase [Anaerolineae bacterium]|jgi:1-acyl-sn-glycerol-3-phosphate acyltransferase|nr:glycerol acyltransferase [Anaerolineae bacterium]
MLKKKPWWQRLSRFFLHLIGWDLVEELPPSEKYILVAAHHTSNWDWGVGFLMMASLGLKPRWVGKNSLFRGIAGPIMRWLGGISVMRGAKQNFVGQIVDVYNDSKALVIALAPEGTRKYVDHWKTGFYHIAKGAQVSIAMAFLDYSKKACGIGGHFLPSENLKADMQILKEFYSGVVGKFPEKQGVVRLED